MPKAFDDCVAGGGKVRTVVPKKGTYIHVCYPKNGGSPVRGEAKHTKPKTKKS